MPLMLIIAILATYRISHMIVAESGPFNAFIHLRRWLDNEKIPLWVSDGFNCVLCVSFWLSFATSLVLWDGSIYNYIIYSLSVAGGALITHTLLYKS